MSTTAPPSPDVPYAGWVGCSMISQAIPFVDDGGMISPLNWRFLYMVFDAINREHLEVYNKFVVVEDQLTSLQNQIDAISGAAGATTHTGTATTDGSGVFTASWPAFSSVFHSFTVASSDPVYPGAGFSSVTSITLSSYSATLEHSNNLYPTATTAPVASTTFNWVATGW